ATLCVNPSGTGGCSATIGVAVTAAAPNNTVTEGKGTIHKNGVITKPLCLLAPGSQNPFIDPTGFSNGGTMTGHNHPGLSNVSVSGFTVQNANFEGILLTDSSFITIDNNHVTGNNKSLSFPGGVPTCPGLPSYFVTFQGFDCGEGIHLSGVDHST